MLKKLFYIIPILIWGHVYTQNFTYTTVPSATAPFYQWNALDRSSSSSIIIPSLPAIIFSSDSIIVNLNTCDSGPDPTGASSCAIDNPEANFNNCIQETIILIGGTILIESGNFLKLNSGVTFDVASNTTLENGAVLYVDGALSILAASTIFIGTGSHYDHNGSIFNIGTISGYGQVRCCGASVTFAPGTVFNQEGTGLSGSMVIPCNPAYQSPVSEALPVLLAAFDATAHDGSALLKWTTAQEQNNSYFVLYRSDDLETFQAIAEIDGNGSTSQESYYSYVDTDVR